jgi:hypothetical protein
VPNVCLVVLVLADTVFQVQIFLTGEGFVYVGCGARALRVSRGTQTTLIPTKLAREEQHGWTTAVAARLLRIVDGVRLRVGQTVGDVGEEQHGGGPGLVCHAPPTAQRTHSRENTFNREGGDGGQEPSASQMVGDVRGEGGLGHVEHRQHRQEGGDDNTRHDAAPLPRPDTYISPPLFLSRSLSAPSQSLAEERDNQKRCTLLVANVDEDEDEDEAAQKLMLSTAADHLLGPDHQLRHSGHHLGAVLAPANAAHQVVYCPEAAAAAVAAAAAAAVAAVAAGGGSVYTRGETGGAEIEVVVESGEDLGKQEQEMLQEHAALQEQEHAALQKQEQAQEHAALQEQEQAQGQPLHACQGQPLHACQGDGIEWPTSNAKDGRSLLLLEYVYFPHIWVSWEQVVEGAGECEQEGEGRGKLKAMPVAPATVCNSVCNSRRCLLRLLRQKLMLLCFQRGGEQIVSASRGTEVAHSVLNHFSLLTFTLLYF